MYIFRGSKSGTFLFGMVLSQTPFANTTKRHCEAGAFALGLATNMNWEMPIEPKHILKDQTPSWVVLGFFKVTATFAALLATSIYVANCHLGTRARRYPGGSSLCNQIIYFTMT